MHQLSRIRYCRLSGAFLLLCIFSVFDARHSAAKSNYLALCWAADATDRMRVEACGFAGHDRALSDEDRALALARRSDTIVGQLKHEPRRSDLRAIVRTDLEEARRLAPENPDVQRSYIAFNSHDPGTIDNQLAAIDSLIGQGDESAEILLQRGIAYFQQGQNEKALADVTKATKLDPHNVDALMTAGQILTTLMRNDESVAAFTQALALAPNRNDIRLQRIGPAVASQQFEVAKEDGELGLTGDFAKARIWDLRGVAHYALGDYKAAAADFATQLQLDNLTSRAVIWQFLAEFRAGTADASTASAKARELGAQWPSAVLAYFAGLGDLSTVFAQAGDSPKELREVRAAQAHFYIAEWALLTRGGPGLVREHLAASEKAGMTFGTAQTLVGETPVFINDNNILEMSMTAARLREVGP
ncbi:tetratricopeptide repeat protein [Dongia sp.]|uniref:tetratricopeptide repeat protein n=1 Tax=Dongia sp. TaxID=1977262 RepID=UPI0035B3F7DC